MRNIIITVLIFSGIIAFASYSGIVKINAPENLFGKADEISSDGFQYVGKVNLLENQQVSSSKQQINDSKNNSTKQSKTTNITSIITSVASATPVVSIASTTPIAFTPTSTALIEPIAPTAPISVAPIISATPVTPITQQTPLNIINIGISEILVGIDGNADYEFIELYNPNDTAIDLTGWKIIKRNSKNNEETLVSAKKFENKKIMPHKYLLLANKDGYGSTGSPQPDILYSTTLAYKNNAVVLYNANGEIIEDIGWDEIIKGQSLERVLNPWNSGEFKIQNSPNPQNSQY